MKPFKQIFNDHLAAIILSLLTIGATSAITIWAQRTFITKSEENNLIRELIPSLISSDPRQTDMALMLLKETLSDGKYEKIKKIIDKKVEQAAEEGPNYIPADQQGVKSVDPKKSSTRPVDPGSAYASLRPEWNQIVTKKRASSAKPLSKAQFLSLLERLDSRTNDKIIKGIIVEAARNMNNDQYYKAYFAAAWVMRVLGAEDRTILRGLAKTAPDLEERKAIEHLNVDIEERLDLYNMVDRFDNLISLRERTANSVGEAIDISNAKFLENLRKNDSFDWKPKPPEKHMNKFEDIR